MRPLDSDWHYWPFLEVKCWKRNINSPFKTFLVSTVCACMLSLVVSDSSWPYGLQPARLLAPWSSPGKNTGVGFCALLQGIFLTQESNLHPLGLLRWQAGSLPLAPPGKLPSAEILWILKKRESMGWSRWGLAWRPVVHFNTGRHIPFFFIYFLYNTVLVLPYIDMNPPRVYMRSQTWTPLPPPSP